MASYAASISLFQRLFVAVTGERSDAAIVITTLVLATTFTPIKQRLERVAKHQFGAPASSTDSGGPSEAGDPGDPSPRPHERELDALADLLAERVAERVVRRFPSGPPG